jgi:hypothetical protein
MKRYLESKGLGGRLAEIFEPGEGVDLLSEETRVFSWADKGSTIQSGREEGTFRVKGDRVNEVGIAFVPAGQEGVDLSGGLLSLRYRSAQEIGPAIIELKPAGSAPASVDLIPIEIFTRLDDTSGREAEIRVTLPATPGLTRIKEVVLTLGRGRQGWPIDLSITRFGVTPTVPGIPADADDEARRQDERQK